MNNIVVYYHAGCPDGFGSAWSFYKKYGKDISYIPYYYDDKIKNCKNKEVYFVDCSASRETLLRIKKEAKSVTVLDHHISAFNKIGDLDFCHFNMDNSGCVIVWKHLFPLVEVPIILQYIEDRDLWKWELEKSKEILTFIDSFDRTVESWNMLNSKLSSHKSFCESVISGGDILRYRDKVIEKISKNSEKVNICGYNSVMINSSFFQGEIADNFTEYDVVLVYYKSQNGYKCSLRTRKDNVDVSKIAEKFGGGGHEKASGFLTLNMSDVIDESDKNV